MDEKNYITGEVKALIGRESEKLVACDAIERGSIRRFAQAIMDDDPLYWNDEYSRETRFKKVVAPPLFPVHMFQRPPGAPDPLAQAEGNPDYDGTKGAQGLFALPEIPIPFKRLLNGGVEVECFKYGEPGDTVAVVNKYLDIFQKQGKKGPMIFAVIERRFRNQKDELLLLYKQTLIYL